MFKLDNITPLISSPANLIKINGGGLQSLVLQSEKDELSRANARNGSVILC